MLLDTTDKDFSTGGHKDTQPKAHFKITEQEVSFHVYCQLNCSLSQGQIPIISHFSLASCNDTDLHVNFTQVNSVLGQLSKLSFKVLEHTVVFGAPDDIKAELTGNKGSMSGNNLDQTDDMGTRTASYVTFQICSVPQPQDNKCRTLSTDWYMQGILNMHVLHQMDENLSSSDFGHCHGGASTSQWPIAYFARLAEALLRIR